MSPEEKMAAQPVEPGTDPQQDDSQLEGGAEATRLLDLNAALSEQSKKEPESAAATPSADLGDLLTGLLGGGGEGAGLGLDGIAERSGVSRSALSAALPLVLGALLKPGQQETASGSKPIGLADLASLAAGGKPLNAASLEATGLPAELAKKTGIDSKTALTIIQAVLKALGIGKTTAKAKAKAKAKPNSKAKAKPKPKTTAKPKAKAKPKPKTTAKPKAKAKPKPKTASKPKPKTTSKPKATAKPKAKPKPKATAKK